MGKIEKLRKSVVEEFGRQNAQKEYRELALTGLWKSEEKLVERYFRNGSRVLDIGCGTGRTTMPLARIGYKVVGIDITPEMIKGARETAKKNGLSIDYRVGDATKLDFLDESFDNALFSFNGWCQIPGRENRQKALEEVLRVLKPNGYFIFTAHIREIFGKHFLTWLRQGVKYYILRPFGFEFEEADFGDVFFKRDSTTSYKTRQYIHIPSYQEVLGQVRNAGFEWMYSERRNTIAPEDSKMKSGNCMFYVCRKVSRSS